MFDLFQARRVRSHRLPCLHTFLYPGKIRRLRGLIGYCLALLICCLTASDLFYPPSLHAATREFKNQGELIVVSPSSQTAVIDIAEKNRQRIIGGKLAPDAVLLINGSKVDLHNFQVGESVQVVWRLTDQGKEILSLIGTGQLPAAAHKMAQQPIRPSQHTVAKKTDSSLQHTNKIKQPSKTHAITSATQNQTVTHRFTHPPILSRSLLYQSRLAPIIGKPHYHTVAHKETLLDIARNYDLGFNELTDLYPEYDPWLPPEGKRLKLPTERILPEAKKEGIVINVAELRLYHFLPGKDRSIVRSFPVSIGDPRFQTPSGTFTVGNKVTHPTWFIPPSLRPKYQIISVPPGPDNPLGKYWMGLKGTSYGIHGTDIAWSIGRTVTHGCIRMYPEDISRFYPTIRIGTPIQLTYEPVKIANVENRILLEVHKDIYAKVGNMVSYARAKIQSMGLWHLVDHKVFMQTIQNQHGIPVDITITGQSVADQRTLPEIPIMIVD